MEAQKKDILTEISTLTRTIEDDYPELQKYLDESRGTLPKGDMNPSLGLEELEDYRNTLKNLIEGYKK
ncbi:hypothetical protein [Tamlana crocina]|uniref:Uncharacterized protein n=1 Tax=Tamlana crocina TaxID=393006 RepID=A0ABX1D7R9_9FLAO|nr:hypothetical protein [Tamlana crocina]NJX14007.1 hypothetical protein [Tamlana crocina]